MANILQSITDLLKSSIQGDPPPPLIVTQIGGRLEELMEVSVDPSGNGIGRWIAKLHEITHDTRLFETLLVRLLQMNFTRGAELLTLLGIIKFEWAPGEPTRPLAFSIEWEKFNDLITKPGDEALQLLLGKVQAIDDIKALQVLLLLNITSPEVLLELEYRQQGYMGMPVSQVPGINSQELLDLINTLVHSPLLLPLPLPIPLTLDEFKNLAKNTIAGDYLKIEGPALDGMFNKLQGLAIEVHAADVSAVLKPLDLGDGWTLGFGHPDGGTQTFKLKLDNNGIDASVPSTGQLEISISKTPVDGYSLLIGEEEGTHFSIKTIGIGVGLNKSAPIFTASLKFGQIAFALKPDFLNLLSFGLNLPKQLTFQSDVELNYVQGKGLSGQGTSGGLPALGIEFATPLNLKIGGSGAGLSIDQVTTRLEVKLQGSDVFFQAIFRYGATAEFGPLRAVMDGAGVWIGRWTNGNGGLLPPQGIGVFLDAGPVKGGGFLKSINDTEFAGAFQLKILGIGAFAYCVYKTLSEGTVSFVALIGIRLPMPGVQISFGFAVTGFGGLVGINRRADTDLIRERLASGAAGDVLFNDDPMRNAPKLLGDMRLFFPDEVSSFIVGPTLQINWLYILKLDVGVFIQLPGPKIFIAGSAKLVIGSEEFALVYLRMDFVGGIDAAKCLIFFDANLVNSHVLGIFRITGGVALRIAYGENGYFLFSVGGFHPSFNPGSMELPKVQRVGVSYALGPVWLKMEMYLAITSNTFQLGSRIEAGIKIGPIAAHGWFAFDALIQFKPFYFVGRIDAGFDVEVKGVSLCNVRVTGILSGPGPLVLQARASVRVLFVKISKEVTIKLNNNPSEQLVFIPDLPLYLKEEGEISNPDNLRAEGDDTSVIFAPAQEGGVLFAPVGEIIWEQKRVPLNLIIQKIEGVGLNRSSKLITTTSITGITEEKDWFGVGTYLKIADTEALNTSRFTLQQSGIRVGAATFSEGISKEAELAISLIKLPKRSRFLDLSGNVAFFPSAQYVNAGLSSMLGERLGDVTLSPGKAQVTVGQEEWNVHNREGSVQNAVPLNAVQAFAQAKQTSAVAVSAVEIPLNLTEII